jgi:hypothetical protein
MFNGVIAIYVVPIPRSAEGLSRNVKEWYTKDISGAAKTIRSNK